MINAVRVDHPKGSTWVEDATSIATYGAFEASVSVPDELSPADIQRRGQAVMRGKTGLLTSLQATTATGPVIGDDAKLGDYVTIDGSEQRIVGVGWSLDEKGDWGPRRPEFAGQSDRDLQDADRALDKLIRVQGGGTVDAAVSPDRLILPTEPMQALETLSWSFYDGADSGSRTILDDNTPLVAKSPKGLSRMAGIWYDTDFTGATGNTVIELWKNGSEWDALFRITIPATTPPIWVYLPTWGYDFVEPGDKLAPRVTSNGQHKQISYHLMMFPAV